MFGWLISANALREQSSVRVASGHSRVTEAAHAGPIQAIESLLIVFKIAINDYHDLPYAAVLIVAIALLLYVFGRFVPVKKDKPAS